jgi:hypothetical protein
MDPIVAKIAGGLIALCVFGLPLGIIGFLIASVVDRKNAKPTKAVADRGNTAISIAASSGRRRDRRLVVYSGYATEPAKVRSRLVAVDATPPQDG